MKFNNIDSGKNFDWGKTSSDYGKYRDIYPEEFYQKLLSEGIGKNNQMVLDLGTGTGVIPRNMKKYGANFIGVDVAQEQIEEARILTKQSNLNIEYIVSPAEDINFKENYFDGITACQCMMYFDKEVLLPKLHKILKKDGLFAVLNMWWLPLDDFIAGKSEELIVKYNPDWTGKNAKKINLSAPKWNKTEFFSVENLISFEAKIPFTIEHWNGRIKASRGISASLSPERVIDFEREHIKLLNEITSEKFEILHFCTMIILKVNK